MKENILIVDDEECVRFTFTSFLEGAGYRVETAASLADGITCLQKELFDLLFLDIEVGRDNGLEAIEEIKAIQPNCSIVIITGDPNPRTMTRARGVGAADYLVKPIRQASLLYIVRKTLVN